MTPLPLRDERSIEDRPKVGDTVTSASWDGLTAVITEIRPYKHMDGTDGDCAILDNGGFWRGSGLVKVS